MSVDQINFGLRFLDLNVTNSNAAKGCGGVNLLTSIKIEAQNRNKNKAKCKKLIPIKSPKRESSATTRVPSFERNSATNLKIPTIKPNHNDTIAPLALIHL